MEAASRTEFEPLTDAGPDVPAAPEPPALPPSAVSELLEPEPLAPLPLALEPEPAALDPLPPTLEPEPPSLDPLAPALEPEPQALTPLPLALEAEPAPLAPLPTTLEPEPAAPMAPAPTLQRAPEALAPAPHASKPVPVPPAAAPAPAAPGPRTTAAAATAPPAAPPPPHMDRDFIARNQIVERYLSGKLPIRGATDFERFCKAHPELLDELGLPDRVNAALRLLEASGKPEPWQEAPKKPWEKPYVPIALGAAVLVLSIGLLSVADNSAEKDDRIAALEKHVAEQPLDPATNTRTIRLLPSYKGGSNSPAVIVGADSVQLADLKIDLSRSKHRTFRITIDRIDQGRVAILHNLQKDSNGHVRLAFNTSALGPGEYQLTIEGLTWKGEAVPDAWITIGVQRPQQ